MLQVRSQHDDHSDVNGRLLGRQDPVCQSMKIWGYLTSIWRFGDGPRTKIRKNPCFLAETGFSCRFFPLNQSSEDGPKLSTARWGAAAPWMLHDPESRRILDPSSKTWAFFMGFPTKIAWWSNKKRVGLVYTCKWLSRLLIGFRVTQNGVPKKMQGFRDGHPFSIPVSERHLNITWLCPNPAVLRKSMPGGSGSIYLVHHLQMIVLWNLEISTLVMDITNDTQFCPCFCQPFSAGLNPNFNPITSQLHTF